MTDTTAREWTCWPTVMVWLDLRNLPDFVRVRIHLPNRVRR